jgi:hypothetical protein
MRKEAVVDSISTHATAASFHIHSTSLFILHPMFQCYITRKNHIVVNWKVEGLIPYEVTGFFNWPNPSSRTMASGSTQPLTEMSTRNLPGGKGRQERKADNLTVICEPII